MLELHIFSGIYSWKDGILFAVFMAPNYTDSNGNVALEIEKLTQSKVRIEKRWKASPEMLTDRSFSEISKTQRTRQKKLLLAHTWKE